MVALKRTKVLESESPWTYCYLKFASYSFLLFSKSLEKTYVRLLLHGFADFLDTFQEHFEKSLMVFADDIAAVCDVSKHRTYCPSFTYWSFLSKV